MATNTSITRRHLICAAAVGVAAAAIPTTSSAKTFSSSDRRCATCDFWGGSRTLSPDKSRIETADNATGICGNPKSPLYQKASRADQVFNNGWTKWRELA